MMYVMLFAALLPPALLWLYIWKKDPQKEPTRWLVKATLWGVGICVPVAIVERVVSVVFFGDVEPTNLFQTTATAFFVAAIPEEAAKLLVLWLVLRKNPFFDEHFDGIVYAVCVGLGFAAIENVCYVFTDENWLAVAVARSLLSVPGHYAFAVLMGYYYALYHFVDRSTKNAILMFVVPMMAHGIYDTFAMSAAVDPYIGSLCFFALITFCSKMHKVAYKKIKAQINRDEGWSEETSVD